MAPRVGSGLLASVLFLAACGGSGANGSGGSAGDAATGKDAGDATTDASGGEDAQISPDADSDGATDAADEAGDAELGETGGEAGDGAIPPLSCPGDANEPDDSQVLATPLGMITDCDSSGGKVVSVSSGTADVDWSYYSGSDTTGCVVDPTVQIDAPSLEVCMFIVCATGTTTVSSCGSGSPATSPAGTPGCCITGTSSMTASITCSALTSDSADVYMRVRQLSSNACVPYDLAYHF